MQKSLKNIVIVFFLLLATGRNANAFNVVQTNIETQSNDASKAVTIVADFLSVFEEGIVESATGISYSSSTAVRTITLAKENLNSSFLSKLNRHTVFNYLNTPLAEVKPSAGLHIFLCVLLI